MAKCLILLGFVGVLWGVSLCVHSIKRGEGVPTFPPLPTIKQRTRDNKQDNKRREDKRQEGEGQKLKKLQKKIFFLQTDSKKNRFSIGG